MRILGFSILFALNFSASGQSSQQVFGTPENEENYPMIRLTNGDYVFAGNTKNFGFGGKDVLVTRTDAAGNLIWSKQYGGSGDETAISISETSDNGFVIGGESFSIDPNGQAFIFKVDAAGGMLWWKNYGGAFYDITYSVLGLANGSIVSAGLMETSPGDYDAFLMKTDASGDTLWTKVLGLSGIEHAVNVIQTSDSGFVFCGKALGIGQGVCECWIVKTDMNGDTLWTSVIGGQGWDEGMDIIEQPNGYIVCGGSNSEGNSNYDFILMQLDLNGQLVWVKQYGGIWAEASYCVQEIPGEGFVLAGSTETFSHTNTRDIDSANAWIVKTNYTGDTLWSMVYGGSLREECFSVATIPNAGIAIAGFSRSYGDSLQTYLFTTDTAGYSGCTERRTEPIVFSPAFVQSNYSFNVSSGYVVSSPSMSQMTTGTQRSVNCGSPLGVTIDSPTTNLFANPVVSDFLYTSDRAINQILMYSINGDLVSHQTADNSQALLIHAPDTPGLYILKVEFADGKIENYKVVAAKQ